MTTQEEAFPEDEEDGDVEEQVLNWGTVMKQTWFLVIDIKDVTTGFGPTKILTLKDRNQETLKVWGSKVLNGAIQDKWVGRGDGSLYVKCVGKSEKKGNNYYIFKFKNVL